MSFIPGIHKVLGFIDPATKPLQKNDPLYKAFGPKTPPPPPQVPNPNDAANAAQSQTDAMRMRRGLLANIYAGAGGPGAGSPVSGKTQLGT
jgi:hypothetical protein